MKASMFKRILAYVIDFFVILLISNIIVGFLPNNDKIIVKNNEITEFIMENKDVLLSNDVEKMETFNATLNDYSYDLSKLSLWPNLLKITLYFLYFITFQSYNNGQTLGKRILKLETVDKDGDSPKFKQMLIRGIILYPILFVLLDVIFINILSKSMYFDVSNILYYIKYGLFFVCFITALISGRGIHDKLAGTSVIVFGTAEVDSNGEVEDKVTKWKKSALKEKEVKKYKVNHTSGKRKE
jgi:uncharacterized RDD family membrane protein YckC